MAANKTAGVKKKRKYTVSFYLMLLHCSYNKKLQTKLYKND